MEEWKVIPGYEGLYEASSEGRIRTANGKVTSSARFPYRVWRQRILKPKTEWRKCGKYYDERVSLWKDGVRKDFLVARLVAMAFAEVPYDGLTVNHINGNPMDNRAENLEWVTLADNIAHGFDTGLYDAAKKQVVLIDDNGNKTEFRSMTKASEYLGRNHGYVSSQIAKCAYCFDKNGKKYIAQLAQA